MTGWEMVFKDENCFFASVTEIYWYRKKNVVSFSVYSRKNRIGWKFRL